MGIHNILALSMNPQESGSGFTGENKSPWIPMTHKSEYPCTLVSIMRNLAKKKQQVHSKFCLVFQVRVLQVATRNLLVSILQKHIFVTDIPLICCVHLCFLLFTALTFSFASSTCKRFRWVSFKFFVFPKLDLWIYRTTLWGLIILVAVLQLLPINFLISLKFMLNCA